MTLSQRFAQLHLDPGDDAAHDAALRLAKELSDGGDVMVVSACFAGELCRYDGGDKVLLDLDQRAGGAALLPICPEVLAGLGVPRSPMLFEGGDGAAALAGDAQLVNAAGVDCTAAMRDGVGRAMALTEASGATRALLKARSPSCAKRQVHTAEGLIEGQGMFAAALTARGVGVSSEED